MIEPVKLVLERRVKPGAEAAFQSWFKRLAAIDAAAIEGSSVLVAAEGEYFVLLRFKSQDHLDRWRASPEIVSQMAEGEVYAGTSPPVIKTGLETWFTLPGAAPHAPPARWKMALVTWLALLPQVLLLGRLVPASLPYPLAPMISTAIPVVVLTWVALPWLTRALSRWLYPQRA